MYIAAHALRSSGRMPYQARDLASAEGKSLRSMNTYIDEMEEKGICVFRPALNQYELGELELCDIAWPYVKETGLGKASEFESYKLQIREALAMRPCILCRFSAADVSFAEKLFQREIKLVQITRAFYIGCAAKYISLLNDANGALISRLSYFGDVIEEVGKPLPGCQNWSLLALVMTKYELSWCVAYLASAVKRFKLTSHETERVLKLRIDEVCVLSHERKLEELTEDQASRVSCFTRIFSAAEHSRGIIREDWFTAPNSNRVFSGKRPLDSMSTGNLEELEAICSHIRALAGY